MNNQIFTNSVVSTSRIIYTPSNFAKNSLLYLQEVGSLKALNRHVSSRKSLDSYLFFIVKSGDGEISYNGETYRIDKGDCVFINCNYGYMQQSGSDLWDLLWVHFNGINMPGIYTKYLERGGLYTFKTRHFEKLCGLVNDIFMIANGKSYIKDMEISEKLMILLTTLMSESWPDQEPISKADQIKEYLDNHYLEKITLDALAKHFYLNKFYITRIFKAHSDITVNDYVLDLRITKAKELLRFTDKSMAIIAEECGFYDANYFSRIFKKIEGISPSIYRKTW